MLLSTQRKQEEKETNCRSSRRNTTREKLRNFPENERINLFSSVCDNCSPIRSIYSSNLTFSALLKTFIIFEVR
jgi:hypothetical protein